MIGNQADAGGNEPDVFVDLDVEVVELAVRGPALFYVVLDGALNSHPQLVQHLVLQIKGNVHRQHTQQQVLLQLHRQACKRTSTLQCFADTEPDSLQTKSLALLLSAQRSDVVLVQHTAWCCDSYSY